MSNSITLAVVWKVPLKNPKRKALQHMVWREEWKGKRRVGTLWPRQLMKRNRYVCEPVSLNNKRHNQYLLYQVVVVNNKLECYNSVCD